MKPIELKSTLLSNIKIVLVEPSHPGNIGSVARAMKTMGLSSLVLVNPKKFPHAEATKLAAGADSVLEAALVLDSVADAVKESTLVLGTSVRDREVSWPTMNPKKTAHTVIEHLGSTTNGEVAVLFGRESSGLTNEELDLCQTQIRIDANADYSSLNLASAVQIIAYEMRMHALSALGEANKSELDLSPGQLRQQRATKEQKEGHLQHLQSTIESLDFVKVKPPTVLMRKLTRLYNKADLSVEEIQILRGILSATQQHTPNRD